MKMSRWFLVAAVALVWTVTLAMTVEVAGAGAFDGTRPFLCAITTVMECDAMSCDRFTPEVAGAPTFFRVDVGAKTLTVGADRTAALKATQRLDGKLVLQGGEHGRGWSATIEEQSGTMAAAVVDDDHTFSLFGA
jgi:hypothetical protein